MVNYKSSQNLNCSCFTLTLDPFAIGLGSSFLSYFYLLSSSQPAMLSIEYLPLSYFGLLLLSDASYTLLHVLAFFFTGVYGHLGLWLLVCPHLHGVWGNTSSPGFVLNLPSGFGYLSSSLYFFWDSAF